MESNRYRSTAVVLGLRPCLFLSLCLSAALAGAGCGCGNAASGGDEDASVASDGQPPEGSAPVADAALPDGSVLPCSSFEQGVGNLLREPFEAIWNRRTARYWRRKEFLPPGCGDCGLADLCCGACPLYWDERGDFSEIADHLAPTSALSKMAWRAKRQWLGQVKGVGVG